MRILYVAVKHSGNQPRQGLSFDHYNFFHCLHNMGHDILYFDFGSLLLRHGREAMNRRLVEVARAEKPDLMFCVLVEDELDATTLSRITERGETVTLNWFCDDHVRFESFSRRFAPCFHWVVTTAHSTLPKYEAAGIDHVLASQWACNPFLYRKLDLPLVHDVTFVGALHGHRGALLQVLRQAGYRVEVWGRNAPNGPLAQERMIEVFNQSRINLSFTNFPARVEGSVPSTGARAAGGLKNLARGALLATPVVGSLARRLRARQRLRQSPQQLRRALDADYTPQIKGRCFEVPGCGGFALTGGAENLEDYFRDGEEMVIFGGARDLERKVGYFLEHEEERARIAEAGHRRARREHTYVHRFHEIFERVGLPAGELEASFEAAPGEVLEVT